MKKTRWSIENLIPVSDWGKENFQKYSRDEMTILNESGSQLMIANKGADLKNPDTVKFMFWVYKHEDVKSKAA